MKKLGILALSAVSFTTLKAQTLQDAIRKTDNEQYADALVDFNALLAKEPNNGANYFYFGDYYFERGEFEEAEAMWSKGARVDAIHPLSAVAKGRVLWMHGDQVGAKAEFQKALDATKKDKLKRGEIIRGIAEIYIKSEQKNLDEAILLLSDAIAKEPKNEDNFLLMGDAQNEKNQQNASEAVKYYNMATAVNPKSAKGLVRIGVIYRRAKNPEGANENFKKAEELDPNFAPAFREHAEMYLTFDKPKAAIECWKKYLELNNSTEARYRYATALFKGKQYCETITEIGTVNAAGFTNFYTERMLGYSFLECSADPEATQKGLAAMDRFFATAPANKIIYLDYKTRGALLSKSGSDSLALLEYERASAINEVAAKELAGDMAKIYSKNKKYDQAIAAYNLKASTNKLNVQEEYDLGKCYYVGPKNYALADSSFARVTRLSSSYAPGYLWRARANLGLDPGNKNWSAQPHYTKFVELIKPEERGTGSNKASYIEACKYLAAYNKTVTKDLVKMKSFYQLIIEVDPKDAEAKTALGIK